MDYGEYVFPTHLILIFFWSSSSLTCSYSVLLYHLFSCTCSNFSCLWLLSLHPLYIQTVRIWVVTFQSPHPSPFPAIPNFSLDPLFIKWQPTTVFLPGKSHGWRSLAGYIQSIGLQGVGHDWETCFFLSWPLNPTSGSWAKIRTLASSSDKKLSITKSPDKNWDIQRVRKCEVGKKWWFIQDGEAGLSLGEPSIPIWNWYYFSISPR